MNQDLRIEEFPGIVFRSGPTGRRAGIAGGPDIWEIVRDLKAASEEEVADPIHSVAHVSSLDRSAVELAASYYAAYPDDIDERIRTNEQVAERLRHVLGSPPTQSAA